MSAASYQFQSCSVSPQFAFTSGRRIIHHRSLSISSLQVSTIDVDVGSSEEDDNIRRRRRLMHRRQSNNNNGLLSWSDIIPLSLHATACFIIAIVISTYEDYDVTHTRPNPSTIRMPTSTMTTTYEKKGGGYSTFNFIGAATRGMGCTNRDNLSTFEEWYGSSATTLQWKPSYNEIMLHHRSERVPRWKDMSMKTYPVSMEQLEDAVSTLYKSLEELDELKVMADNYMWDDIRSYLEPITDGVATATTMWGTDNDESPPRSLTMALEYSMDVLRTTPIHVSSTTSGSKNVNELPNLIGFDWGSCALRHCGAKADAQEAVAELYNEVGMLEPFEVRFIIDVVERSIRDVLAIIPDDIKPHQKDGTLVKYKPYVPYIAQGASDGYDISPLLPEYRPNSDYEYTQTLSELRVDLSLEE